MLTDVNGADWFAIECELDFGDGSTAVVPSGCQAANQRNSAGQRRADYVGQPHTWAEPGTYTLDITARGPYGGVSSQSCTIHVDRRQPEIALDALPGAPGVHEIAASLIDTFDPTEIIAGRTVVFQFGAATATGVTDTDGVARVTLSIAPGTTEVSASFAGDTLYAPAVTMLPYPPPPVRRQVGNCGTEYAFALWNGCESPAGDCASDATEVNARVRLLFVGQESTSVRVDVEGIGYSARTSVGPNRITFLELPFASEILQYSGTSRNTIHIRSSREICTQVFAYSRYTTDAALAFPVERAGTDYIVGTYAGRSRTTFAPTEFVPNASITATDVPAAVTVLSPFRTFAMGVERPANIPYEIALAPYDSVLIRTSYAFDAAQDLTGTRITSTAPVTVMAGHNCANIPVGTQACDYLIEQMPPVSTLGRSFLLAPFATRLSGYLARVVAAHPGTEVRVNGALVATLAAGQHYEHDVATQAAISIETSEPALVVQLMKGTFSDFVDDADPSMLVVPPRSQFGNDVYTNTAPDRPRWDFDNWLNVIAPIADVGGISVNGAPITTTWTPIPGSAYAYTQIQVGTGTQFVRHPNPAVTFHVQAYGWQDDESYGYPAQIRLVPETDCAPTPSVPGDLVDNECDGRIDEELPNALDDDGDGLTDEDLTGEGGDAPNLLPIAHTRVIGTVEDTAVDFVLSGFDPNGDPLVFEVLTLPGRGVLSGAVPSMRYVPEPGAHGDETFTFRVCDPSGCSSPATMTLRVIAEEDAPAIGMAPVVNALEDALLSLPCVATPIDVVPGCDLSWELLAGPPGMTLDPVTADIFWLPGEEWTDALVSVTVRVTDCRGVSATFSFGVTVQSRPDRPIIISRPVTEARVGQAYQYDVNAIDPDPMDAITGYFLDPLYTPSGLTINEASGVISWSPTALDAGEHEVRVLARDSVGLFSLPQVFTITVGGDINGPSVELVAEPSRILDGESSEIAITVTDDLPGAVIESATIFGPGYPPTGAALALTPALPTDAATSTFVAAAPGVYPVVAVGVDASGNRTTRTTTIRVLVPGDDTPPAVELTAPVADAELTYLHDAIGSVFDTNLYRWTLDVRRHDRQARAEGFAGEEPYRLLAEGTENASGTLAQIDTTQLENGLYVLRLRGEDVNGQVGEDSVVVRVEGGAKVGVVQLSFVDLVTEDFGIPLAIVRSYDSRRAYRVGDFGHGWELEMRMGSVQSNIPTGQGYAISTQPEDFTPCTRIQEQQYHFTEVRLSDDEWYLFHPEPVNIQTIAGGCAGEIAFEQTDGSRPGATLEPVGSTFFRATSLPVSRFGAWRYESNFVSDDTGEPVRIESFVLTTRDGRTFWINTRDGVTDIQDRNGNSLSIRNGQIASSSGRGMNIVRDARGRITQVLGGDGRSVGYSYDGAGNLVSFLDPAERTTRFEYRNAGFPHHLTDIIDWRGVRVAAIDYQADGRLGRMCDADGVCQRSSYDLGARQMTITDGLGIPNRYTWDQRGNVTAVLDGLGNLTEYAYGTTGFSRDKLIGVIDPLGNVTNTFRDPSTGDVIERVLPHLPTENAADFTTSYQYDDAGHQTRIALPSGAMIERVYDSRGNETELHDGTGRIVRAAEYGPHGELVSETVDGETVTREYAAGPRASSEVTPDGTTTLQYDAADNLTVVDAPNGRTTARYDAYGREISFDGLLGTNREFVYGDGGEWTRANLGGAVVTRQFSSAGRLLSVEPAGGTAVQVTYDALGRPRRETDGSGAATTRVYDAAGRLTQVSDETTGALQEYERDAVGRPTAIIDATGARTEMTYHPSGTVSTITDAVGSTWTFSHTPTVSTATDPLGRQTQDIATPLGVPTATIFSDGTRVEQEYARGLPVEDPEDFPTLFRDEAGRERRWEYTPSLELTSVTDPAGATWSVEESDDGVRVTTPSGRVHSTTLDVLGRPVAIRHEDATVTEVAYGDLGGVASLDRAGVAHVSREFDVAGRETRREEDSGRWREMGYGSDGHLDFVRDATGTTHHLRDAANRRAGLEFPSGASVTFARDLVGRIVEARVVSAPGTGARVTTYTYEARGLIESITDPEGGTTLFLYDTVGRRTQRTLPNGIVTTWTYDLRDRVSSIRHVTALGLVLAARLYTRATSGEPTRIEYEDASYTELQYDDALRVTAERTYAASGTLQRETLYGYDSDGVRTSVTTNGTVAEYRNGAAYQLQRVEVGGTPTQEYVFDAAGRTTSMLRDGASWQFTYDAADELLTAETPSGTVLYQIDGEGRRVSRNAPSGTVRYLVAPTLREGLESPHAVTDDAGNLLAGFVFDGDQPLARYGVGGTRYYLEDEHGSVIATVDGAGAIASLARYDSFGNIVESMGEAQPQNLTGGDFRFHGMWLDATTHLYDARARSYDPVIGRFLSPDAIQPDPRLPETFDRYRFANANPHVFTDPTGLFSLTEAQATGQIERIMQELQLEIRRNAVDEAKEAVENVVGNLLAQAVAQVVPGGSQLDTALSGFTAIAQGRAFEDWLEEQLCSQLPGGTDVLTDILYLTVPLGHDGHPEGNGLNCAPATTPGGPLSAPSRSGRMHGFNTHFHVFPDAILSPQEPEEVTTSTPRTYLIVDFKIRARTVRGGSDQTQAIIRHAASYSWSRSAIFFTLFRASRADQRRLMSYSSGNGVYARIVSLL